MLFIVNAYDIRFWIGTGIFIRPTARKTILRVAKILSRYPQNSHFQHCSKVQTNIGLCEWGRLCRKKEPRNPSIWILNVKPTGF